jgi:hypothetical protein
VVKNFCAAERQAASEKDRVNALLVYKMPIDTIVDELKGFGRKVF